MPQTKKILHVIGVMDRGGAESLLMNVYRGIDKEKFQFDFLVHEKREGDYDKEIKKLGGSIYSVRRFVGFNLFQYKNELKNFFFKHHDYDVVHVHIGFPAAIILHEAKKWNIFTIVHSHAANVSMGFYGVVYDFFSYPTRYLADYYLACSLQAGKDRFGKKIVDKGNFYVLKNGIKVRDYIFSKRAREVVRKELGISDGVFVVGHVGRFVDVKNHAFLIKVFKSFFAINPNSILCLLGRGPNEQKIKHEVEVLGIAENVRFLGVRDDVPRVLNAFDAFVFPSTTEGLGMAAVEAQASGLPCVLSSGLPQIAFCSVCAEPMDLKEGPEDWAKEIAFFADRLKEWNRRHGAEEVKASGFDIQDSIKALEDLYNNHCLF